MLTSSFAGRSWKWLVILLTLSLLLSPAVLAAPRVEAAGSTLGDLGASACRDPQQLRDPRIAAACYWRGLLADENGNIPNGALARAYAQIQQMRVTNPPGEAGTTLGPWTSIGPGNIGGRIRGVVVSPSDPNTVWLGSVGGGVFKTTDGGVNWATTFDFLANIAVSTLIIDPTNANTLYAGTGEGFFNVDALQGAGVFKTTDGGATWAQLASTSNPGANCDWCYVNRLAISPNGATLLAAQNIFATGQTAIWRSTDGGATWGSALTAGPGSQFTMVQYVAFDPTDSSKAVASGNNGAWRSTDGGATWAAATLSPAVPDGNRIELGYAASSPNIVYAAVQQNNGDLYKSTDGGASYTRVNTGQSLLGGQGWYDNAIWVNPFDANFVIVGGTQTWYSRDGGVTFTSPGYAADMHPDHHVFVAAAGYDNNTNKRVYVGNDGGIYRTDDVTATPFPTWTSLNNNLPITQFWSVVGHDQTGRITGGTQDNGTPGYTGGYNTWVDWTGGDGGRVGTDQTDAAGNIWYGEYTYLQISRSTTGFTPYAPGITGGGGGGCGALTDAGGNTTALFMAPFVLDPNSPSRLLGGGASLWLSANVNAATPCWSAIKTPVAGALISAIAVKQGDSNTIWVGYTTGRVDMTTNGGTTWTQVGSGTLPGRQATAIAIDPTDSNNVYVTYGGFGSCCYNTGNVWRTTDAGANWTDISGGLPAIPILSVTVNPMNHNYVYVGTISGIFETSNALGLADAPIWSVNQGPANVSVTELTWMGGAGGPRLLAATHGRSIWTTTNIVTAVALDDLAAGSPQAARLLWLLGGAALAIVLLAVLLRRRWYLMRSAG